MAQELKDKKIAILVSHGFEQSEMMQPRKALDEAGAKTVLISDAKGKVKGWRHDNWGDQFPVDLDLSQANAQDYDALLLPGGVMNPDHLRLLPSAIEFIKKIAESSKPIAAICHGP